MSSTEERDGRQTMVRKWTIDCFGKNVANDSIERVSRIFEEVVELCQTEDLPVEIMHKIISHVYARPVGKRDQEIGGISITLLAYCELKKYSADQCEKIELRRILGLPKEHFSKRQQLKANAGVAKS